MSWFMAHAIFCVKLKEDAQEEYPIWENIYLIEATSSDEALLLAEKCALENEAACKEMTYDDKPALFVFKGIRKVNSVHHFEEFEGPLKSGDEVTHSRYEVASEIEVDDLANGKAVNVLYDR